MQHTPQDSTVIILGVVGLTVFGLLFPIVVLILLWSWSPDSPIRRYCLRYQTSKSPSNPIKQRDDPGGFIESKNKILLGWLYTEFRVEVYFMSAMHLVHRFFFVAIVSLLVNPALQLLCSVILTSIFAIWFVVTRPYYNDRLNVLQATMYASILIQLGIGQCYYR